MQSVQLIFFADEATRRRDLIKGIARSVTALPLGGALDGIISIVAACHRCVSQRREKETSCR